MVILKVYQQSYSILDRSTKKLEKCLQYFSTKTALHRTHPLLNIERNLHELLMNLQSVTHWNNRRSCRVFFCFYSAIFQLTSAKFQTFAYNSRTIGSSYMKFWQQFKINELHVCTKFRGNRSRDFDFRTWKLPCKFGVKSGLSQKRLKYGKKHFIWLYVSRYHFIPTNPFLAAMRFFSFFFLLFFPFSFPFFSSQFLYALLLLNHKTWKSNFCVKLLSCKCKFLSRNFLGQLHQEPPLNGAPKNRFFERLKLGCYFFLISVDI